MCHCPQELLYDIHFWIGEYSTQDEYGTAAYKTVELDTLVSVMTGVNQVMPTLPNTVYVVDQKLLYFLPKYGIVRAMWNTLARCPVIR